MGNSAQESLAIAMTIPPLVQQDLISETHTPALAHILWTPLQTHKLVLGCSAQKQFSYLLMSLPAWVDSWRTKATPPP